VSRFNLEWSPLLSLPDNDMIDEDIYYILLQANMSVPPENPEGRRMCTYLRRSYTSCQMR